MTCKEEEITVSQCLPSSSIEFELLSVNSALPGPIPTPRPLTECK